MKNQVVQPEQIEILESLGFTGTTDEELRPQILEKLASFDVLDVEGDSMEDLINMIQAFIELEEVEEKPKKEAAPKVKNAEKIAEPTIVEEVKEKVVVEKKQTVEKPKVEKTKAEKPKISKTEDKKKFNPDDKQSVEELTEMLKSISNVSDYEIQFKKSCVAFKLKKSNSQRSILILENVVMKQDSFDCNIFVIGLKIFNKDEYEEIVSENLSEFLMSRSSIKPNYLSLVKSDSKILDFLFKSDLIKLICEKVSKLDDKLQNAREKMEKQFEEQ